MPWVRMNIPVVIPDQDQTCHGVGDNGKVSTRACLLLLIRMRWRHVDESPMDVDGSGLRQWAQCEILILVCAGSRRIMQFSRKGRRQVVFLLCPIVKLELQERVYCIVTQAWTWSFLEQNCQAMSCWARPLVFRSPLSKAAWFEEQTANIPQVWWASLGAQLITIPHPLEFAFIDQPEDAQELGSEEDVNYAEFGSLNDPIVQKEDWRAIKAMWWAAKTSHTNQSCCMNRAGHRNSHGAQALWLP